MREIDQLRPLTAGRLLSLWQACREETEDPLERALLCNAGILAACCFFRGERVYGGGMEALEDLTGLEMERQTKEEIKAYMDNALKGYTYSENEDVNAISYAKGQMSYTFRFDDDDILKNAIARNNV